MDQNNFNNGRVFYDCPGQTGTLKTPPPVDKQPVLNFGTLKEPGPGPEQKQMEDQAAQAINTPQDKNLPAIPGTALTRFDMVAQTLADIRNYQNLVVDIRDKETFDVATKAKSVVRELRLKIQRREKEENAKLNKSKAALKKDATLLKTDIKETEDYLAGEIKKWNDEKARLKKIEDEKEAARKRIVNQNFDLLVKTCNNGLKPNLSAADIKTALGVLNITTTPQEVFQEKYQDACNQLTYAIENTQRAYNDAVIYENRQAEMAQIKKEGQRVDQVAFFNENFGVMADLATMEAGLKHMEAGLKLMDAVDYANLAELIQGQIETATAIIEKTRAAQPAPDPVEETPAPEKKAPRGTTRKMDKAREIPRIKSAKAQEKTQAAPQGKKAQAPAKSEFVSNAQLLDNFKTIDSIINAASPGSLELILSNGQASAPIMLSPEGLHAVMALVKTKFEKAVKGL